MYKDKKILLIIPARGGSKDLPRKNIKLFIGKPVIAWTIEQAKKSRYVDKSIVSTDDKEIAETSKKYGVDVPFLRPTELAGDKSPVMDTIMHTLNWFEEKGETFDIIVLFECTSPLRKDDDLDNAIKLLIDNWDKADSLLGTGEISSDTEHPYGIKKIENGYLRPFIKGKNFYQRQQLPKVYSIYGGVYISKTDALKKHKSFYQKRTIPYFVEQWQNYEIDDLFDFICVEAIFKHRLLSVD